MSLAKLSVIKFILLTHRLTDLKEKADNNLNGLELSKKQLLQLHLLEEEEKWIREHLELAKSGEFPSSLTEASTLINQHKVRMLWTDKYMVKYKSILLHK